MKKTFKIKALVLCMIAVMIMGFVPSVKAAAYNNGTLTEDAAEIVCSLMADKTDVNPGDTLTVVYTLDKVYDEGIVGTNLALLYDSSKLTLETYYNEEDEEECYYIVPGTVAEKLNYDNAPVVDDGTDMIPNGKIIRLGMAAGKPYKKTGTIMTFKFKVNENAIGGKIDIYAIDKEKGGFSASGYNTTVNPPEVDYEVTRYLKSNLTDVKIDVPAESVEFEGITGVTLDTAGNKTKDVSTYVVINPEDCTELDTMTWTTEDKNVATVANGVITAVGKGTTNIVVTVGNCSAKLPVTVTVPLQGVEFKDLTSIELDVTTNKTKDISGNVVLKPAGAEAAGYEWSSDNTAVATVANGVVTAVGKGTANIKVAVGGFEATVPVTVKASVGSVKLDVEKVVLDTESNKTYDLGAKVVTDPANADVESITWESSDEDVVTVDDNGVVTVVGKGTATITVTVDGKTATVPVSVTVPITGITLDKTEVEVFKNDTAEIVVTAAPEGAEWSELDASFRSGSEFATVEVVDGKVVVTGVAEGTAVVEVVANKATTGELVKLFNVTVKENKVTDFQITVEEDTLILRGETKELIASFETEIADRPTTDDTKITWESSDETIATVDENGVITGHKEGNFTITATMAGFTSTYEGSVMEIHAEEIIFSDETVEALNNIETVLVGEKVEIPFEIAPEDCTDTMEEVLEFVNTLFDEEMVDVEVTYDEETQKGTITVTTKAAGIVEVYITGGEFPEDEESEQEVWLLTFEVTEPVVEEEVPPATGDMPVALFAGVMFISLAGIVVSKKVLVK